MTMLRNKRNAMMGIVVVDVMMTIDRSIDRFFGKVRDPEKAEPPKGGREELSFCTLAKPFCTVQIMHLLSI
jgi:hypothetical protein